MKVLIVEDDCVGGQYFLKVVSKYGAADLTINGLAALNVFNAALEAGNPYDLVLLDIMMPLYDGEQVLKSIRKAERIHGMKKKTKVVIVSALDDTELTARLVEYGIESYLVKPVDSRTLMNVLETCSRGLHD